MTQTPLSMSKGQRSRSPGCFTYRSLNMSGSCSGECGNVLGVGIYCYIVVCSAALGASAPTEGGEGRGHIMAAARLQLYVQYYSGILYLFRRKSDVVCWWSDSGTQRARNGFVQSRRATTEVLMASLSSTTLLIRCSAYYYLS